MYSTYFKGLFPVFLCLLFLSHTIAQSSIAGRVTTDKAEPVPYANVLLLLASDSSLVKGAVTSDDGSFLLSSIDPDTYLIKIAMVGNKDLITDIFSMEPVNGSKDLGPLILEEDAVLMNEVQVVAKKPLFEQKIDRMVVNVANSITSAGTNALEVLARSPGVMVNQQSNMISISGKSGVVVMINGRINYMPADAVIQLLQGISSDNIDRLEIITTPPSGLDAEGNAGYINIVLKKNIEDGFNGSYAFSIGYGKGETGNANLNFNYRKGKCNLFGNYGYLREGQSQVFAFYRRIMLNGDQVETDTRSDRFPNRNNHNARLGLDYQLDPKTVVGALVSGFDTKWVMDATNLSSIVRNGVLDTLIRIENSELNQWKHLGGNVNVQHTFSEGRTLTVDGDYLSYRDSNPTDYNNHYEDGTGNFLFENYTRSRKSTPITIKTGKLDYLTPIGKKIKMETGLKGAISNFTNDVGVDYRGSGEWISDPGLTAKYNLEEKIAAAYVSFDASLSDKMSIKAGLRYEYTNSNLGSVEEENIVDRKFGEIFPTFYLSRTLNKDNSVNVSYGKRITRPTFTDMAPFIIFLDPSTFFSGNPALQPAVSHNVELGYRYKSALMSLKYAIEDSSIANFQSTILEGSNTHLIFAENLKQIQTYSLTLSFPFTPVKWWNMYFNFGGVWQKAKKYESEELLTFQAGDANLYTSQTFTLPANFTLEVTGLYASGGLFGIFRIKPFGFVNVGLQKKFGEHGGTLRLGYDDVFHTQVYKDELDLKEQHQYFNDYLEFSQPTVKLSYTRNFGNQKIKGTRERTTGSEEEKQRVNSN